MSKGVRFWSIVFLGSKSLRIMVEVGLVVGTLSQDKDVPQMRRNGQVNREMWRRDMCNYWDDKSLKVTAVKEIQSTTFVRNQRHQVTIKPVCYLKIGSFCLKFCRAIQIPRHSWQGQAVISPRIQGHKGATDHEYQHPECTMRVLGKEKESMDLRQRKG